MPDTSPLILAIDQGSSSTKALLVNPSGVVVGRGSAALAQQTPRPGWVEHRSEDVLVSVRAAVASCLQGQDAGRIRGVGLGVQRESTVVWDEDTGTALGPVLSWQDQRTADRAVRVVESGAGAEVRARTGLPVDPMFSALKARWLLDAVEPFPALRVGTLDAWLVRQLTGASVAEVGSASRTQLLDLDAGGWAPELCELFGVPPVALPPVVPSTGPFGPVCALPGLLAGTPLLAVMADSHAALFAHGAWGAGAVKATYGTGSSIMGVLPTDAGVGDALCRTVAWDVGAGPVVALEGNIRSSGATLLWLASLLGQDVDALADLAAGSTSDGVHIVPAFGGLGAPWWDPRAQGVVDGLTLATTRATLARAAFESVAFQVEDVVEAAERAAGPVTRLLADGGPTRNAALMQLQADLGGRPVERSEQAELSALGVAQLAAVSAGLYTLAELAELPRPRTTFAPVLGPAERGHARRGWRLAVERARLRAQL